MKKVLTSVLILCLISVTLLTINTATAQPPEETRVIIGFKNLPDTNLIQTHGWKINHQYHTIPAIACSLPKQAIDTLKKNPQIAYIEEDAEAYALDPELTSSWGVNRIGAGAIHDSGNQGAEIKIAVIDTGINYNHPDLNDNYKSGIDYVNDDDDPVDDNGHGTHCAGIIAAENNDVGVVGVAPAASLFAVKVLDSKGSGYVSDVVAGIDWSITNGMQVISMSLGSTSSSTSLQQACNNAYNKGIVLVAAAGNSGQARIGSTVTYPARYSSVIAVGATDSNNARASWSSTGPELELSAPGVNILSTYLNGAYATMSGTSMACPHVAGTATLVLSSGSSAEISWQSRGYTNGDGTWSNIEVRTVLDNTADDLGTAGKDNLYGYGLVDADEAALPSLPPPSQTEKTYAPIAITMTRGTITSGDYSSLANNGGAYLTVKSARVNSFTQTIDWYSTTQIAESPSTVTNLKITYDGKYSTSQTQKLYIYDYTANSWLQIDSRTVSTSDTTITWSTTNPAKYISAQSEIRLRVYASGRSSFTCYADFTAYTIKYPA
jgi:subtilisin family serine protease